VGKNPENDSFLFFLFGGVWSTAQRYESFFVELVKKKNKELEILMGGSQ
jgi:hypothetical protein